MIIIIRDIHKHMDKKPKPQQPQSHTQDQRREGQRKERRWRDRSTSHTIQDTTKPKQEEENELAKGVGKNRIVGRKEGGGEGESVGYNHKTKAKQRDTDSYMVV